MSNNQDKKDSEEKGKLLHFPDPAQRKKRDQKKFKTEKQTQKQRKEREKLEEEYRRQYKEEQAKRAKLQSDLARTGSAGKTPFINWHRIPPFSRTATIAFLIVYLYTAFLIDKSARLDLFLNFGFVPAYYSGTLEWSWKALIAPFSTALLHANWLHLLTNCVMMLAMGVFFERQFGTRVTIIFFIVSLMCGNLMYFVLSPAKISPVVGASGAISGLFGGFLMTMNINGMAGTRAQRRGPLPIILLWLSIMIGIGLISTDTAWQSHLGGFLGGLGLFQLWRSRKINL
ncbi:MAG: rhomboid family intramembrane serine protease [Alphaproteobacteria bacterium]